MARSRADQPQKGRLVDMSKGMVDVVHPALLDDAESKLLKNASLDEKGTLLPCLGRTERFSAPFDATNACNGIAAFYPDTATSRLVMGAGMKLFKDTPHLINRWTDQTHFEESGSVRVNCDTASTPGDIKLGTKPTLTFSRASTAYKQDGTSVVSGVLRHEYMRLPYHRWQDPFDTDQIAAQYISGGDVAGTTTVSGGVLSYSGGTQATLLKKDLLLQDCEIEVNCDQAEYGGIIARHQDNGNYYLLALIDDSSVAPNNFDLYKRLGGTFTSLATANVTWPRGTAKQIRLTFYGSRIEAYFDGVKVISVNDTTFTGGGVGLRNSGATAFRVFDFTVYYAVQGVMVEEGATNLLTVNQASIETDLTGFVANNATITRDTTEKYSGSASLKVVTSNLGAWEGITTTKFTASADTVYSAQARVKGASGTVRLFLRAFNASDVWLGEASTLITLNGTWQHAKVENYVTPANTAKLDIAVLTPTQQSVTFFYDFGQVEQKAFCTTPQVDGTARAAEALTVPTTGVFNKGNWTVDLVYRPISNSTLVVCWGVNIDANNWYRILIYQNGTLQCSVCTGGVERGVSGTLGVPLSSGLPYFITFCGDGGTLYLFVNGTQIGTVTYTEPSGSLPANMYIGSDGNGNIPANGILSNLRISSRVRTLAEHQAAYNTGLPLTADEWTTCLAPFNGNIAASDLAGFVWTSATKDVSVAVSTASGKVERQITTPGASIVAIETRTSANGTTWDPWTAVLADGTIQSTYRQYIQVRARGIASGTDKPSVQGVTLSYDGTPTAAELASGFTAGGQFYFATLLSKLVITNKLDAPRVWDGINAVANLGGSPPHAQYVAPHKNYLFMAHTTSNPSRLYFSDVLNIENWPALNFIDVSPNDGDWITGLLPYDDYLIITKNRSIWLLVGTGISDFEVRRLHAEVGCVAPRSLVRIGEAFAFVAHDGIYMSDLSQPVLISERLKKTWQGLNRRRLNQACAAFFDHKLRVDVPNGASTVNNLRIVYDSIRKALLLDEVTDHASSYTKFVEAGQEILLYGHSNEGQISQADNGSTDAGQAINFTWESKHFDFGLSEHIKRWRKVLIGFAPASSDTVVNIAFVVDGGAASVPIQLTIPGDATKKVHTARLLPSQVGVVQGHSIGLKVTQSTTNGGVGIHSVVLDYFIKGARPTL